MSNIREWVAKLPETKKAFPILSFPCVSLLGVTVKELINDNDLQARGMALVAKNTDSCASVSLMDLSVEAECFGAQVIFSDDEVPNVTGRIINTPEDADALEIPKVGSARSGLYIDAIKKAKALITDRPVFAGMIGTFSLAARLLDVSEIMMDCYDEPEMVHTVLEKCNEFLIEYAKAYKAAGADGVVIAEPVSGLLSPSLEEEFSSPYIKNIADAVQDDDFAVIYHNCGDNTIMMTESILTTGCMAYHFGNAIDMKAMLEKMPDDVIVMGNVDPAGVLCMGSEDDVKNATLEVMQKCRGHANFVISSGCDIPPKTPWRNLNKFFETVREYYGRI